MPNETVETPVADTPAVTEAPAAPAPEATEAERMEAVFAAGTEAAAAREGGEAPPPAEGATEEEAPPPEEESEAPPAEEEAPPAEPVALTDEEQDAADAKALGFKNQKANTEFKAMRAELRELRPLKEELEQIKAPASHWTQLEGYMRDHNITPEIFRSAMTMAGALQSNDLNVLRMTRDQLLNEVKALNGRLGDAGHGYDPLQEPGNYDLRRAVEDGEVTAERAAELARTRHEAAHYQRLNQQTAEQQRAQQAREQAVARAQADLDAIQAEYTAIDPAFEAKASALVPILKPIFAALPPDQWAAKFREAYRAMPAPAAARAPAGAPPLRNQPLRAAAMPPGGPAAAAKTPDDIMAAAIAEAARKDGVPYRVTGA